MENTSDRVASIASTYASDTILLLGKGPSLDEIDLTVLEDHFSIAVNDVERVAPVDVTIFHDEVFQKALVDNGLRSRLYVTSTDFPDAGRRAEHLPFVSLPREGGELQIGHDDPLNHEAISEVIFLTALAFCQRVAQLKGRRQTVIMLGFDFDPSAGFTKAFDSADPQASQRAYIIAAQEPVLRSLLTTDLPDVEIIHIGKRPYSRMSPAAFNISRTNVRRRGVDSRLSRVSVVAELTTNHFGQHERLERMIREAAAAGADYIKVQKRDVDSFYSQAQLEAAYRSPFGDTFGDYRRAIELNLDGFQLISELCEEVGVKWFASVLDRPSLEWMLEHEVRPALVKLPSTISEHAEYIEFVSENWPGDVVVSTGMTNREYEAVILGLFAKAPNLYLMQANSAYPTPDEHCNVAVVRRYESLRMSHPNVIPAYSSHDAGWFGSALAVAAGARMIEKHVKWGTTDWAHFDSVALDLSTTEFADYVSHVRHADILCGSSEKTVTPSEHHKYSVTKAE